MDRSCGVRWLSLVLAALAANACSKAGEDAAPAMMPADTGGGTQQPAMTTQDPGAPASGAAGSNAAGSGAGEPNGPIAGGSSPSVDGGTAGSGPAPIPPEVMEMLDPDVDWTALSLVYPTMYSAYDGEHTFQVPVYVDGLTIELSDWEAIPSSAVIFDPDPESDGVMVTIAEPAPQITIAARSGMIGGTAPLIVTLATPEDWAVGEARYYNGVDYMLPMLNFADLIDPNWTPPPTPPDLACNNCHTMGAKYFEIQHTPTQIARISDEDLVTIFTTGMKPPGVGFSVIPEAFQHLYADFHSWEAGPEGQKALIVFLRSLTPTPQGEVRVPGLTPTP